MTGVEPAASTQARQPHVLLVDDEAINLLSLERFLSRKGYRVSSAPDGQAALALADRDPPDLVVTDMRMPRLSGAELVHRLRIARTDLPVVIVTGYTAEDGRIAAMATPGLTLLTKPLDPLELLAVIRRLLGA